MYLDIFYLKYNILLRLSVPLRGGRAVLLLYHWGGGVGVAVKYIDPHTHTGGLQTIYIIYIPDQFILERMATTANCLCLRVYVLKALFFYHSN